MTDRGRLLRRLVPPRLRLGGDLQEGSEKVPRRSARHAAPLQWPATAAGRTPPPRAPRRRHSTSLLPVLRCCRSEVSAPRRRAAKRRARRARRGGWRRGRGRARSPPAASAGSPPGQARRRHHPSRPPLKAGRRSRRSCREAAAGDRTGEAQRVAADGGSGRAAARPGKRLARAARRRSRAPATSKEEFWTPNFRGRRDRMSLLVFLLLTRPGGGTGGAEASPPRVRARGAAPEPTCWRRRGATPGAEARNTGSRRLMARLQGSSRASILAPSSSPATSRGSGLEARANGPIRRRVARKHPTRPRQRRRGWRRPPSPSLREWRAPRGST